MSGNLFSMRIILSPLISRMLIYIFLLLSVIDFYFLGCNMPYQWRVLPFGLATASRVLQLSLKLPCSFTIVIVSILLPIWMISWSWFTLSGQVRGLTHFCVLYWFALDYILIFPILTFASQDFWFFRVMFWILSIWHIFAC